MDDGQSTQASSVFSWSDLNYSVNIDQKTKKYLLKNMNGWVKAGEVVAIMGGSGAGKSTLLNTLAGRIGPGELSGEILINGKPRSKSSWNLDCAYVEQDDLMLENLTVFETISYSAALRIPSNVGHEEKLKRVNTVISQLGLESCRNTRIGNELKKGVSGGERKRIAIAIEMVTNPELLFLDEPTSGLDSFNAFNTVQTIQQLSQREKKMVMMTIHQPRTDILKLFDKVILLSQGQTVWYGTTEEAIQHFKQLGYELPDQTNPSDFFIDIITIDQRTAESRLESTTRINNFINEFHNHEIKQKINDSRNLIQTSTLIQWPSYWINEVFILTKRSILDLIRDSSTLLANFVQPIILSSIISMIYYQLDKDYAGIQNRMGVFFFLSTNISFSTIMPLINVFPEQKRIIKRERSSGTYRPSSAFLSKFVSLFPVLLISTLILIVPVYFLVGLQNSNVKFLNYLIISIVHLFSSFSLGLLISSAVPSTSVGQLVGPLVLILMMLFGGLLVNLDDLPVFLRWIQWISLISYSYKSYCQNEFDANIKFDCVVGKPCLDNGTQVINSYSLASPTLWECVGLSGLIGLAILVVAIFVFSRTSRPLLRLK
ncbi:P-loop containing nucleoside triphosphate hydrolase protein [Globomyces pollinis-pini]|nr:P-loop containing nucleoside triphosphate hydrolase protein [Globomyces pollinis-pini]